MAPIRASNLVWQLPYDERKSILDANLESHFNRISKMQPSNLKLQKKDSVDFQKASGSDSEFENVDDHIDEFEEMAGASRAVKLSIRAIRFNKMLSVKDQRMSLLARGCE